jgi:hypothetical protein
VLVAGAVVEHSLGAGGAESHAIAKTGVVHPPVVVGVLIYSRRPVAQRTDKRGVRCWGRSVQDVTFRLLGFKRLDVDRQADVWDLGRADDLPRPRDTVRALEVDAVAVVGRLGAILELAARDDRLPALLVSDDVSVLHATRCLSVPGAAETAQEGCLAFGVVVAGKEGGCPDDRRAGERSRPDGTAAHPPAPLLQRPSAISLILAAL